MRSLAKNILLHNQSYQNQEISMTKCYSLICKPHWDFPSVPWNACSDPQARPVNTLQSAVNSLQHLLICSLVLCFMIMTFFKISGQLLYRLCLWVSLAFPYNLCIFGKNIPQKWVLGAHLETHIADFSHYW